MQPGALGRASSQTSELFQFSGEYNILGVLSFSAQSILPWFEVSHSNDTARGVAVV